jgi:YtxH-like protein
MVKDFAGSLPSAEDIIRALGLSNGGRASNQFLPDLAFFGAGILVGAGLALLFAPSSGRELREDLGERAHELRERVAGANGEATETTEKTAPAA